VAAHAAAAAAAAAALATEAAAAAQVKEQALSSHNGQNGGAADSFAAAGTSMQSSYGSLMDAAGMFAFMSTAAAGGVPLLPGAFDANSSLGMGSGFPRSLGQQAGPEGGDYMATSFGSPSVWGSRR